MLQLSGLHRALIRYFALPLVLALGCDGSRAANEAHRSAGFELLSSDPDEALRQFAQVTDRKDPETLLGQGLAHLAKEAWAQAETTLAEAAKLAPREVRIMEAQAQLLLRQDRISELYALAGELHKVAPRDPSAGALLALAAQNAQELGQARKALEVVTGHVGARLPAEYVLLREHASGARLTIPSGPTKVSDPASVLVWATSAGRQGKRELAGALVKLLAKTDLPPQLLIPSGQLAVDVLELDAALTLIQRLPPTGFDVRAVALRASYYVAKGQHGGAIREVREGLKREIADADRARLSLVLARALLATNELPAAREVLQKLLVLDSKNVDAGLLLSRLLLKTKQTSEAVTLLSALHQRLPERREIVDQLAEAQLAAGNAEAAEATLRELLATTQGDARIRKHLVIALLAQKKTREADALAEQALAEAPHDLLVLREVVYYHLERGQLARALELAQREATVAGQPVPAGLLLAEVHDRAGNQAAAFEVLTRLAREHPTTESHLALSRWYKKNQRPKDAIASAQSALALSPTALEVLWDLASLSEQTRDHALSASIYEKLIAADPQNLLALNNAAMLFVDALNEPGRALDFAQRAYALDSRAGVADTLGWTLFKLGRPEDQGRALELLSEANSKVNAPEVRYHYAAALLRAGRKEAAKPLLKAALEGSGDFAGKEAARKLLAEVSVQAVSR